MEITITKIKTQLQPDKLLKLKLKYRLSKVNNYNNRSKNTNNTNFVWIASQWKIKSQYLDYHHSCDHSVHREVTPSRCPYLEIIWWLASPVTSYDGVHTFKLSTFIGVSWLTLIGF